MTRFVLVFALAAGASGCAYSPFSSTPASGVAPAHGPYYQPGVRGSEFECMTDEGYGRSHPCGNMS